MERLIQKDYYELKREGEPFEIDIAPKDLDFPMEELRDQAAVDVLKVRDAMQSVSSENREGAAPEGGEKSSEEDGDQKMSQPTQGKYSMSHQYKRMTLQGCDPTGKSAPEMPVFQPYFKPGYQLLLGGQNLFVFFKQFYTVYERLIKAQQIISDRVDSDLQHKGDEALKLRTDEFKREKYEIFLAGVLSAISQSIDANKYEDFARAVIGNKAYLLFSFDKLVIAVSAI